MPGDSMSLRERRQQQTLLDISNAAIDLFAAKGFAETTVDEIAAAAGVSVRTFHRYLPTKEDAITPALAAGWTKFVTAVRDWPEDQPVIDGLVSALEVALDGSAGRNTRTFLRELLPTPALKPMWLRVHERGREALRPGLAERLALDPESVRAQFVSACVIDAIRVAVEASGGRSSQTVLATARECLELIAPLLQPERDR